MGKTNSKISKAMDEFVITPGGIRPKKNVHLIEPEFDVKLKDGALLKVSKTTNIVDINLGAIDTTKAEHFINRNILRSSSRSFIKISTQALLNSPVTDGWIIYSGWLNETNKPISYFNTSWVVPPPPATDNGQLIYLFNGIEDSSFSMILQPVLQWGNSPAGGGSFWAIANWFVGSPESGIALHSPLVRVEPGTKIKGVITLRNRNGNKFSYLSSFTNISQCDLSISDITELTWANETLECYRISQFSDYPNTLKTSMSDIEIRLGNNTQATILWDVHNDVTDNGQHCSIISNSSPNGAVDLFYR